MIKGITRGLTLISDLIRMLQVVEKLTEVDRMALEDFHKKKIFARLFGLGMPLVKALYQAGFARPNRQMGAKLLADETVLEELDKTLATLRHKLFQEKELIISQLDTDREFAYDTENPAAAIAATVAKAKILGLMDRPGDNKNMPKKIEIEWGEENKEVIYEKSNPLVYGALEIAVGAEVGDSNQGTERGN